MKYLLGGGMALTQGMFFMHVKVILWKWLIEALVLRGLNEFVN